MQRPALKAMQSFYCAAVVVCNLHKAHKAEFKTSAKYVKYQIEKEAYICEFKPFKTTWKNISPREEKGALVLKFPKANQISNGERDTLCLVAALVRAKRQLKQECAIIIIDEVFDYLDDANLIACQYHITEMIASWKREGRQLVPIILTHLDPGYFRNFTFKNQQITYLARDGRSPDGSVQAVIIKREHATVKEDLSKYFLHFHPAGCDLTAQFKALNLNEAIGESAAFNAHINSQLKRYLDNRNYDPVAVCCAVRNIIERKVYERLDVAHQADFLGTHKTPAKLKYAQEKGFDIPEQYFLLSVVYNEAAHLMENRDNITRLFSKLDNLTIRHMIQEFA